MEKNSSWKKRVILLLLCIGSVLGGANNFLVLFGESGEIVHEETPINQIFPDVNLAQMIQKQLQKPEVTSAITQMDLDSITSLSKSEYDSKLLTNLEGTQYLRNLAYINIHKSNIQDLSPLQNLSELTYLAFIDAGNLTNLTPLAGLNKLRTLIVTNLDGKNKIQDISPLAHLVNMHRLNLSYNKIQDISALKQMPYLQYVDLSMNVIDELDGLTTLSELQHLDLRANRISNVNPLQNLVNLTRLNLEENQITDAAPLVKLEQLTNLNLRNNQIIHLDFMSNMTNLLEFNAEYNQIKELSALVRLEKMQRLFLSFNQIGTIESLSAMKQLQQAYLSQNQITDIMSLKGLKTLNLLFLDGNALGDITALSEVPELKVVQLSNTQISDVSPLAQLAKLDRLYMNNNHISNLEPLAKLTNLTNLQFGNNRVQHLGDIASLKQLQTLQISMNQINDLSPLEHLGNLTKLESHTNQISDVSPLSGLTQLNKLNLDKNNIWDISPLQSLTKLSYGSIQHQSVVYPEQMFQKTIQLLHQVRGIDGVEQIPSYISDQGSYSDSYVTWNLSQYQQSVYYSFDQLLTNRGNQLHFSGKVTQPLAQGIYPLAFDIDGVVTSHDMPSDSLITQPTDPTKEGYIFSGWNTTKDGSGTMWEFATMVMPNNSLTLYAQWKAMPLLVTKDVTINIGDTFDVYAGLVEAKDAVDGDVRNKVIVKSSTVNSQVVGIYETIYQVTNSQGITQQAKSMVHVVDKSLPTTGSRFDALLIAISLIVVSLLLLGVARSYKRYYLSN